MALDFAGTTIGDLPRSPGGASLHRQACKAPNGLGIGAGRFFSFPVILPVLRENRGCSALRARSGFGAPNSPDERTLAAAKSGPPLRPDAAPGSRPNESGPIRVTAACSQFALRIEYQRLARLGTGTGSLHRTDFGRSRHAQIFFLSLLFSLF
jgi:hypothetical protein